MDNWCEGCDKHSYPYEAQVPISGQSKKVFTCDEDIWDVINLLIAETREMNNTMGKSFDIGSSVSQQLPFFSCPNIIINKKHQKDISKYIYCKEFNVPPYPGSYESQPYRWILKSNIIKTAISKVEDRQYRKAKRDAEIKKGAPNV